MADKPTKKKSSRPTGRKADTPDQEQLLRGELEKSKQLRGKEPEPSGNDRGGDEPPPNDTHYTPFLVIRYSLNDVGLRPVPSGEAFYESPDIWIESSDPLGRGVPGKDNFVHVRIYNFGLADAAPVKVDFYWGNPALGLNAASMNLIGTEGAVIPGLNYQEVRCNTPWVPIFVNQGHECLMVNCSNFTADPITDPFQPWLDRHVGQRNVTVLPGEAGESLKFTLEVVNLFPLPAQVEITARIAHLAFSPKVLKATPARQLVKTILGHGAPLSNTPLAMQQRFRPGTIEFRRAQRLAQFAASRQPDLATVLPAKSLQSRARIRAMFSEESFLTTPPETPGQIAGNLLLAGDKLAVQPGAQPAAGMQVGQAMMQPFELRQLHLELGVPTGARKGEFLAFHLHQRSAELDVGGYTIVVQVR
jgi:hypothetical protein